MLRKSLPRFDLLEVLILAAFCAVMAWIFRPILAPSVATYSDFTTKLEFERLKSAYGPAKFSEHLEEWVVRDYFHDARNGRFVDVGANDPRKGSNTYYLEHSLSWSGLAIDPQVEFGPAYLRERPRTRFYPYFVSDVSSASTDLYVGRNSLVASAVRAFSEQWGRTERRQVPTITLDELLDVAKIDPIDFLSIDVELSEPKVLAGFTVERFRPRLVCIESHPTVRQQILDYFMRHQYVVVGRYLRIDTDNLYFRPVS